MMKILTSLFLLLMLAACSPDKPAPVQTAADTDPGSPVETETNRLNAWLDDEFAEYLAFSPLAKTRLGDKSDYDKLDDVSEARDIRVLEWRRASVAEMTSRFNRSQLGEQGQLSWDLWVYMLEADEAGLPFIRHRYFLGRNGPHTSLPNNLINYHKVDSLSDMQAYISRLNESNRYFLQYLQRAQVSAAEGIRGHYFTYEVAISQIERVTRGAPFDEEGTTALWADVNRKIEGLKTSGEITDEQAIQLTEDARRALIEKLKPAYDEILAWLQSDIANVGVEARGADALPNGKAFYDYRLSMMTTLPLTADEIHQTGLDEVARIQAEMEEIKTRLGFEGSLHEFFVFMREDDQFYFPNTDEGRAGYLALANNYLAAMEKKLPEFFGILPKGGLEVRRVEAFREQPGAAAHYTRGTRDGTRPGVFYVHLADMRATANYRLEDLAYHEGLPGHHMQIAIQQELEDLPRFRTYHGYTAFSEGWGLYAEFLGKEMGFYEDGYTDFGRLSGEIWRAIRLVVDTGIHSKQWTEAQAVDYALQNSPRPETAVRSEIRRYFNMPAQATAYKVGMLQILRYRAHAEEVMGADFDIRGFHDVVLGGGALPMPFLEARVLQWITKTMAKK
ncbi:MAG TPA: DUF885 domain-containing protein [Gammaproteobacteria bacterium]|nr:DUF885 domain-containing protein [Gammaproteobacteria bacterium]HIL95918.1 DUF885 domain-containing protein [Pseudomonadales bacterium]